MSDRLIDVVARVFNIERSDITMDSGPSEIQEWDSLGQLELISAIESEFSIKLTIEETFSIMKIGDIHSILAKRGIE